MNRSLRVGIDLTTSARVRTGLETYALSLAQAVIGFGSDLKFVVFTSSPMPDWLQGKNGHVTTIVSPYGRKIVENQIWLSRAARRQDVDLMHYPAFPPLWPYGPFVLTIHDLTPWRYPRSMSAKGYLYFRSMLRLWAPRSRAILTVSSAVRDEIVRMLRVGPDRVEVIRPAVRSTLDRYPEADDARALAALNLTPGYILFVGIIEPRKNIPLLIEAAAKLRRRGDVPPIVLAGRPGWGMEHARQAIRRHGMDDRVIFTGHVTDQELAALYRGARFLVQPSIYEGFGLPVLEAMTLGCPVIASRIGAHEELLGDAGEYFSPCDSEELAGGMARLSGPDLRRRYSAAGRARAARFTWQAAAEQLAAAYHAAGSNGRKME